MAKSDPRAIHSLLNNAYRMGGFGETGKRKRDEAAVQAAQLLPESDLTLLTRGEYHDLNWGFCEEVADRIRQEHPTLASRLYELAEESFYKDAQYLSDRADIERVRKKRGSL